MKNLLFTTLLLVMSLSLSATNYYFDSEKGKDKNDGISKSKPFKSLDKIADLELLPGDNILLKKGQVFSGNIELINVCGDGKQPIIVSSYGEGSLPIVDAKGKLSGVLIQDCSYVIVKDIEVTANGGGLKNQDKTKSYTRCGVLITAVEDGTFSNIIVDGLKIHDIFFEEPGHSRTAAETLTGNGTQNYGWGIRVLNSNPKAVLNKINIINNSIEKVSHSGIRFTGKHSMATQQNKNIKNALIKDNSVLHSGGPAMQASVVENIEFVGNSTNYSGSPKDIRNWARGSGLWVWGCYNALIHYNNFRNANGPADSAGCHIDFNNNNVMVQYNVSENNYGGFVEILGNNHNCTYRYNVSINDGKRKMIKDVTLGAGTMIGVNGFVGFDKEPVGPFNTYIYNNTIYVKEGVNPEVGFASTVDGMMIANNIFYIEDSVIHDHRKNFLPESGPIDRIFFENNLYLSKKCWPAADVVMITDKKPMYGDAQFVNAGGTTAKDYIPTNIDLVKDKSIAIPYLQGDTIGIMGGFEVKKDILGNEINGRPDMGAIELN